MTLAMLAFRHDSDSGTVAIHQGRAVSAAVSRTTAPVSADHVSVTMPSAPAFDTAGLPDQARSLCARVRVVVVVPGRCVPLQHCGGGQLAVARLQGQLGDRRDLGYLRQRSAADLGLGRILDAEVSH